MKNLDGISGQARRAVAALAIGAFCTFGGLGAAHAEPTKIAVVDIQRAFAESQAGAQALQSLQKYFQTRQAELDTRQNKLKADKDALDKMVKSGAPQAQLQKKNDEFQRAYAELQNTVLEYQKAGAQKEAEVKQPIIQALLAVVRRIASQDGYEVVLEKTAVHFSRTDIDVTERAIQMFNSQGAGSKPGAPPKKK